MNETKIETRAHRWMTRHVRAIAASANLIAAAKDKFLAWESSA